jgi:hypothetical protein
LLLVPRKGRDLFRFNLPLSGCDSKNLTSLPLTHPRLRGGFVRSRQGQGLGHAGYGVSPPLLKAICYQLVKDRACSELLAASLAGRLSLVAFATALQRHGNDKGIRGGCQPVAEKNWESVPDPPDSEPKTPPRGVLDSRWHFG